MDQQDLIDGVAASSPHHALSVRQGRLRQRNSRL